jgi:hypothetical protein
LKAFFSTYKSMKYSLHLFDSERSYDQETVIFNHPYSYCLACAETIIHFQHFIELVFKEILQKEHPLLAVDASSRPIILHKLLKGETIVAGDQVGLKSIEFSEAHERLQKLIAKRRIGDASFDFIVQANEFLKNLNGLRNRIWHRGVFILRYPALDELIGKFALPFVKSVIGLDGYSGLDGLWKYSDLNCGIDPIEEIVSELRKDTYDLGKVGFLKELGRAAYENPIVNDRHLDIFSSEYRRRAEQAATAEFGGANISDICNCPVCGVKSLVVFDDIETEGDDPLTRAPIRAFRYTWQIKCMCCTFEINHHLKNPSEYGFSIADYWHSEEL